jgi:hypothetical protein
MVDAGGGLGGLHFVSRWKRRTMAGVLRAGVAMVQGRALKEIPLMYKVASQTVSAWEHRQDG